MIKVYDIHHYTGLKIKTMCESGAKGFILRSAIGGDIDGGRDDYIEQCYANNSNFGLYYYFKCVDKKGIALTDKDEILKSLKKQARIYINDIMNLWRKHSEKLLTLGIYIDIEELNIFSLGKNVLTDFIVNFINLMAIRGVPIFIYGNPDFMENRINKSRLTSTLIWLADWRYKDECPTLTKYNSIGWQYGIETVNGLAVDSNYFYFDAIKNKLK